MARPVPEGSESGDSGTVPGQAATVAKVLDPAAGFLRVQVDQVPPDADPETLAGAETPTRSESDSPCRGRTAPITSAFSSCTSCARPASRISAFASCSCASCSCGGGPMTSRASSFGGAWTDRASAHRERHARPASSEKTRRSRQEGQEKCSQEPHEYFFGGLGLASRWRLPPSASR